MRSIVDLTKAGFVTPPPQTGIPFFQQKTPSSKAAECFKSGAKWNLVLDKKIGEGSYGEVFLAVLVILKKDNAEENEFFPCVAKCDKTQGRVLEKTPEFQIQERLMREARSSAHSGIAKPIASVKQDGVLYELYAPGICALEDCKQAIAALYLDDTNRLLHQYLILDFFDFMLRALQQCGKNGIVHADIKPQNIVYRYCDSMVATEIKTSGFVLIDFGCARTHGVFLNEIVGTPIYMAPEVIEKCSYYSAADIMAFGLILEELMGKILFTAGDNVYDCILKKKVDYVNRQSTPSKKTAQEEEQPHDFYGCLKSIVLRMTETLETDRPSLSELESAYKKLRNLVASTDLQKEVEQFYIAQSNRITAEKSKLIIMSSEDSLADLASDGENEAVAFRQPLL